MKYVIGTLKYLESLTRLSTLGEDLPIFQLLIIEVLSFIFLETRYIVVFLSLSNRSKFLKGTKLSTPFKYSTVVI